MTTKEALEYWQSFSERMDLRHEEGVAFYMLKDALACTIKVLEATCKVENSPADARSTNKGMFIPEASDKHPKDEIFRKEIGEIKDAIVDIQIRVAALEKKL